MEFNRELYYNQTEACRFLKINVKRFKQLLIENNIPVLERKITLHTAHEGLPYEVIAKYVLKEDCKSHFINSI